MGHESTLIYAILCYSTRIYDNLRDRDRPMTCKLLWTGPCFTICVISHNKSEVDSPL
jgi:hypothetical protein